jgi:hypothetical protein
MSRAEVTASVPGWNNSRAEVAVCVRERKFSEVASDLNGTGTLTVSTGACHVQTYMTPDQMDKLAAILTAAAAEARAIVSPEVCAGLAAVVDEVTA